MIAGRSRHGAVGDIEQFDRGDLEREWGTAMFHITETVARIRSTVRALLDRADRALCAAEDERARGHGWTVTRVGFGARRYRDPRFDALKAARADVLREAARAGAPEDVARGARVAVCAGASPAPEAPLPPARSGSWS